MSVVPIQPCWAWVTQQGNPQSLSLFAHKPNKQLCHGIRPCVHMYNGTWYAAGVRRQTSNSSVGMTTGTYLSTMVFVFNFAAEVAVNNVLIMKCAKRTARAFFPWFSKEKAYSYRIAYKRRVPFISVCVYACESTFVSATFVHPTQRTRQQGHPRRIMCTHKE